ncbi:MAG: hypothetical protein IIA35_07770, partial [Proteobacteria bacterium]|nr:hypothetical protein [Pseudomonadota bacterium]
MSKYDVPRFRCDVEITPPAKPDAEEKPKTQRLTAGSDGDNYYLIDSDKKIVYVDMDPAVLGTNGGGIQRLLMRVLVDKEPFADELKADTIEKRDDAKVGSVPCYNIYVKSDDGEANWFISKSDLLPRRVERFYRQGRFARGYELCGDEPYRRAEDDTRARAARRQVHAVPSRRSAQDHQ